MHFFLEFVPKILIVLMAVTRNRCSTAVGGHLADTVSAVDGIFGFGPQSLSVISQLASQGLAPKVFSHCLKGDAAGGGILVLGEIVEPSMVYSPLVPSQYVASLEKISHSSCHFSCRRFWDLVKCF